jgi:hypothetical protein
MNENEANLRQDSKIEEVRIFKYLSAFITEKN